MSIRNIYNKLMEELKDFLAIEPVEHSKIMNTMFDWMDKRCGKWVETKEIQLLFLIIVMLALFLLFIAP